MTIAIFWSWERVVWVFVKDRFEIYTSLMVPSFCMLHPWQPHRLSCFSKIIFDIDAVVRCY